MNIRKQKADYLENEKHQKPFVSFYHLSAQLNDGSILDFETLKGKKILLVNTASDCGFTPQYAELQQVQDQFRDSLQVIGFPSNDFKEQEKLSDEEIAGFCYQHYGVRFPLVKKSRVIKAEDQHPVFAWLSTAASNGWNNHPPQWNFSKYLVNEEGILTHYFSTAVSPLDPILINAIKNSNGV